MRLKFYNSKKDIFKIFCLINNITNEDNIIFSFQGKKKFSKPLHNTKFSIQPRHKFQQDLINFNKNQNFYYHENQTNK